MELIGLGKLVSFHILLIYTHDQFHVCESVFTQLNLNTMKQLRFFFTEM